MIGVRLVVEHDVVAGGYAQDIIDARATQQQGEVLDVVLVGHHMVGVAAVAAHGDAGELAHEVVLQACPDDLLAVVQILGTDKADDGVDHKGMVLPCEGVAAGFHRHLVGAVVGVGGQFAALSGLEVHHVGSLGRSPLPQQRNGFLHGRRGEAEGGVALLAAGDGLEDHVAGGAALDRLDLRCDVAEHADLRRDLEAVLDLVEAL